MENKVLREDGIKMRKLIKMMCVFMFCNFVLLYTTETVNANHLFTVGQERFYNNMKNNAFLLKIGKQHSEFHPEYGSTTYDFMVKGSKDHGNALVNTLVDADGYVCRIWLNGTSADGMDTFSI